MYNVLSVDAIPFQDSEIKQQTSASKTPVILTPESVGVSSDKESFRQFVSDNCEQLKQRLQRQGALLFRGFDVSKPEEFRIISDALQCDFFQDYMGGATPRTKIASQVFVSTEAPKPFIIGYHTELCYQKKRPELISFFCQQAPKIYGETPIYDCAEVYASIPEALREKLETHGVRYHRKYYGKKGLVNFHKTWKDVYYTEDKKVVEKILEKEGSDYQWHNDDSLTSQITLPAHTVDNKTGKKQLCLTMFNADSILYNFAQFKNRYNPITYYFLRWFVKNEYKPNNRFLYITLGDGTPFSRRESESIQKACWDNAIIFQWKVGDLLLLDNKRYAHSRLNVGSKRKIYVAMGNY